MFTVEKTWDHKGFKCVVLAQDGGYRCGYVGIGEDNNLYGVDYSDAPACMQSKLEELKSQTLGKVTPEMYFDVHGGITYSGNGDGEYPIESNLWWFGFDCAHAEDGKDVNLITDRSYLDIITMYPTGGIVRSLEYCISECESLADQLLDFAGKDGG